MTKLEEEILRQIKVRSAVLHYPGEKETLARAVAEVSKRYIEKAIRDTGNYVLSEMQVDSRFKDNWLKENGIV